MRLLGPEQLRQHPSQIAATQVVSAHVHERVRKAFLAGRATSKKEGQFSRKGTDPGGAERRAEEAQTVRFCFSS